MGDVDGLRREHINATRTVQQLQAHMRQLEQTRLQVNSELHVFLYFVFATYLKV